MHSARSVQVALAAAALFSAACHHDTPTTPPAEGANGGTPATQAKKMKCFGANACAGQSSCDVPGDRVAPGSKGHDCAGNNECKGKGWLSLTPEDCTAAGGEPI